MSAAPAPVPASSSPTSTPVHAPLTDPAELDRFLPLLEPAARVALDTEADSLHAYREKLCLIQIALPGGEQELVDPLVGHEFLAPLYGALRGKTVVLQGADYDLRLLRRAGGFVADDVFDTMIGARLVGRREFGYAALVKQEFGVELPKGSQKADWGRRPLTATMIAYAHNDTRYLLPLAERLEGRLRELGRWEWFKESCERARVGAGVEKERDPDEVWRITGSGALRGKTAAVLRELWHWRDEEARAADRPAFHVLRNEDLLSAARAVGEDKEAPVFKHLPPGRARRYRDSLDRALALPQSEWPGRPPSPRRGPKPPPDWEKRVDELRTVRDRAAGELDLEPSLIASRNALEAIAARPETAPAEWLLSWQRGLLGV